MVVEAEEVTEEHPASFVGSVSGNDFGQVGVDSRVAVGLSGAGAVAEGRAWWGVVF